MVSGMKRLKKLLVLLCILALATALASCSTYDNFKRAFFSDTNPEDEIVIGVLEPESGEDSVFGKEEIEGIQLAHEMCPTALDKPIRLVYENTQSSTYVTESAIKQLIENEPDLILGCYGNTNALIAAQYIEEAKIPTIGISVTNNLLTHNYQFYTSVSFNDTVQGRALGKYAKEELYSKKIAIFRQDNDDSTAEVTNRFIKEVKSGKDSMKVSKFYFNIEEKDFTDYLQKILAEDITKVFAPISIEAADLLFTQVEKLGMTNITFIGTSMWYDDNFVAMMKNHPEIKVILASEFTAGKTKSKTSENFISMYKAKYGKKAEPSQRTALAFDAYMLAVQSIEKAGATDGEKVLKAILNVENFKGATGTIKFNSKGAASKPITISTLQNHKFVTLSTIK